MRILFIILFMLITFSFGNAEDRKWYSGSVNGHGQIKTSEGKILYPLKDKRSEITVKEYCITKGNIKQCSYTIIK